MNMKNKKFLKVLIIITVTAISLIYILINNFNKYDYDDIYISSGTNETSKAEISEYTSNNNTEEYGDMDNASDVSSSINQNKIKVHVTGEVNTPGIYELYEGDRIENAIIAAGGETENADLNKINLAYELKDGQKIYIPSIFDDEIAYIYNDAGENVIADNGTSSNTNVKVNINKATAEELQSLDGIGESIAQKIVVYREENGKFSNIEELKNVSGIGEKKYEAIKDNITV